ncbi:hypothetical protein LguiA_018024 [Lonicera macranthoides]
MEGKEKRKQRVRKRREKVFVRRIAIEVKLIWKNVSFGNGFSFFRVFFFFPLSFILIVRRLRLVLRVVFGFQEGKEVEN